MLEHALGHPQTEVCGLLGGLNHNPKSYYPVKNIADDPDRSFLMDPQQHIKAIREMRVAGEKMAGIFHSHPVSSAEPSVTDLKLANYPDVIYFILSLTRTPPELNAYYFDGKDFHKMALET
ncbi:MAG: M67 family metallopeptidase [Gammaproteobacteria bacterium]